MLGLVTADVAAPLDPDLGPFDAACRTRLGDDHVSIVSWDDPGVDWSDFDAVIIRSTWDYSDRHDSFLEWAERAGSQTRLINSSDVIAWNIDKTYLTQLRDAGIPIAPTIFVPPTEGAPAVEGVHVVKPTIGAGSNGARRCEAHEVAEHVASLHRSGCTAMVQPYLDLLDERGETAMCFVPAATGAGLEFSHAFRKGAILTTAEVEREGDLFAKEEISPRVPSSDELEITHAVLATEVVSSFDDLAFARIDIAPYRSSQGSDSSVLLELELIEPSFYLDTATGAAELFADRLASWLQAHRSTASR